MATVIIQGSSRSDGNTSLVVDFLHSKIEGDVIDLNTKTIGPFDYEFKNKEDDFIPLIEHIADHYDTLVFVTPVYWYAMSSIMKAFFDRLSDCLRHRKDIGYKLKGKKLAAVSVGSESGIVEGFHVPFRNSAEYLGMTYLGYVHTWKSSVDKDDRRLEEEVQKIITIFSKSKF